MKILHVVPTYLPAIRYGGPIYSVHGLCRALTARGHEVSVFTTNVDGPGTSDVPLDRPVEIDGVRVHYFPSSFRRLYFSRSMSRALATSASQFELVHAHSVFLWPTTAAARAAAKSGVPYVISPRGMLVPELVARKSTLVKNAWIGLLERRNLQRAAGVHFTSLREEQDARRLGIPLPHPFIVPNGIDPRPLPDVVRDYGSVLYLGRINWKKGIDRLITALPDGARLLVAGNDEEGLTPALRRLAKGRQVQFLGPVDGEAKWELLAGAGVLVLPSHSENFGNVVLEAMLMATPVLVTPAVGVAPDVAAVNAGIVTDDIAAALVSLLEDPGDRGANGRRLVAEKFTWSAVAAEMEKAYRCLIESHR